MNFTIELLNRELKKLQTIINKDNVHTFSKKIIVRNESRIVELMFAIDVLSKNDTVSF
jgi:hypothetical protein